MVRDRDYIFGLHSSLMTLKAGIHDLEIWIS